MTKPQDADHLPPAPTDDWARFACARPFGRGEVWFRPRHLAEHHPAIEHLTPRVAVDVVVRLLTDGQRAVVESVHRRAFGPPADLDPQGRWQQIERQLLGALTSGALVAHAARAPLGEPGVIPVEPPHPPIRPPGRQPSDVRTWIEIQLEDEAGRVVADETVRLVDVDGTSYERRTDSDGVLRVEPLPPGACEISFPRIDGREWARWGESFPEGSDAIETVHVAEADECMTRIAYRFHFRSPTTLYRHACNAELRRLRPNPDLLWPRDRVNILVRDDRADEAATGRRHRYVVKNAERWLRVVLHGFDRRPLASAPYVFRVEGRGPVARTTDERGLVEEPIPAWAVHATIQAQGYAWEVAIGALVPTAKVPDEGQRGARQRLANLGYPVGDARRATSSEAAAAETEAPFDVEVWRFQRREALVPSGEIDDAVIHAAVKRHRV